jgi:hypothetical protein
LWTRSDRVSCFSQELKFFSLSLWHVFWRTRRRSETHFSQGVEIHLFLFFVSINDFRLFIWQFFSRISFAIIYFSRYWCNSELLHCMYNSICFHFRLHNVWVQCRHSEHTNLKQICGMVNAWRSWVTLSVWYITVWHCFRVSNYFSAFTVSYRAIVISVR